MDITEFNILNSFYNGSIGRAGCSYDIETNLALRRQDTINRLIDEGLVSPDGSKITDFGVEALKPYKVNNAVILAAGASTRFIPLSLEQPKGLFEVKGEKLIERQIQQLQNAGIEDITIVLGYKKEMFYYLRDRYGVNFIINESFNVKNNIESLYLAKDKLCNTYICVSDSYFVENPFNQYEYHSFNAGLATREKLGEMYVETDEFNKIIEMKESQDKGFYLLGHSFWTNDFSTAFIALAKSNMMTGRYDKAFWEWMVKDHLDELPPFYFKEYSPGNIFEFDYFDDLRKFDTQYLGHTHSEIIRNIKLVFRCDEEDIINFRNVSRGLTNTSFIFRVIGVDYIYRHPGDETGSIISRRHEKSSLVLAKKIGIDPTYIYEDVNEGWKISVFVPEFREPDYKSFDDSKKIIATLRRLHTSNIEVDYGMNPWEDSLETEALLRKNNFNCFDDYKDLKNKIGLLYQKTLGDGIKKCFCHGDTYQSNWMIKPDGSVILIDWEFSGMADPGVDVGYYIADAMYDFNEADRVIKEYLQENYSDKTRFHFMAYTAIIAYYWFIWALYRESCGVFIGEPLSNWRNIAEKYADYLLN